MFNPHDFFYLNQALQLAKIRQGFCAPNPSVGAVIVRDHQIIASGYHFAAGSPHAEIDALSKIQNANNATLYVTLEPCCHQGKTPPCTDFLVQSGLKRVVYGYKDPNPLVSGQGEEKLKAAGIQCDHVSLSDINAFYESYFHWMQTKTPFITAKIALTLDGKIATKEGNSLPISGPGLNEVTHFFRRSSDAILTTSKTILKDDPQLNARYEDDIVPKKLYILDSQLTLPTTAKVLKTAQSITLFHSPNISNKRKQALEQQNVLCITAPEKLADIVAIIGQDGIHDLWVEAGGALFSSLVKDKLIQRAFIYIAPHTHPHGTPAFSDLFDFRSEKVTWKQVGKDVLCEVRW